MTERLIQFLKTLILDSNSLIQNVYPYERSDADGTPFATITPSGNDNDYSTTSENRRVYAFLIRLFVERGGETSDEDAEKTMRELIDTVLDKIDKNYKLIGLTVPAGYSFLMLSAAPAQWGYVGREMNYRVAEIVVRCHFDVDVTVIN